MEFPRWIIIIIILGAMASIIIFYAPSQATATVTLYASGHIDSNGITINGTAYYYTETQSSLLDVLLPQSIPSTPYIIVQTNTSNVRYVTLPIERYIQSESTQFTMVSDLQHLPRASMTLLLTGGNLPLTWEGYNSTMVTVKKGFNTYPMVILRPDLLCVTAGLPSHFEIAILGAHANSSIISFNTPEGVSLIPDKLKFSSITGQSIYSVRIFTTEKTNKGIYQLSINMIIDNKNYTLPIDISITQPSDISVNATVGTMITSNLAFSQLGQPATITGKLSDSSGNSIPNAMIRIRNGTSFTTTLGRAVTGNDGSFSFTFIPTENMTITTIYDGSSIYRGSVYPIILAGASSSLAFDQMNVNAFIIDSGYYGYETMFCKVTQSDGILIYDGMFVDGLGSFTGVNGTNVSIWVSPTSGGTDAQWSPSAISNPVIVTPEGQTFFAFYPK
jgi:hypothetical protein